MGRKGLFRALFILPRVSHRLIRALIIHHPCSILLCSPQTCVPRCIIASRHCTFLAQTRVAVYHRRPLYFYALSLILTFSTSLLYIICTYVFGIYKLYHSHTDPSRYRNALMFKRSCYGLFHIRNALCPQGVLLGGW